MGSLRFIIKKNLARACIREWCVSTPICFHPSCMSYDNSPFIYTPLQHACMHAVRLNCHLAPGWDQTEPRTSCGFGAKGVLRMSRNRRKTGSKLPKYAPFTFPKGSGSFLGQTTIDHFRAQNWPFWGCYAGGRLW